jgi:hypothetical protein
MCYLITVSLKNRIVIPTQGYVDVKEFRSNGSGHVHLNKLPVYSLEVGGCSCDIIRSLSRKSPNESEFSKKIRIGQELKLKELQSRLPVKTVRMIFTIGCVSSLELIRSLQ